MIKKSLLTLFAILFVIGFYLVDVQNGAVAKGELEIVITYEEYSDVKSFQFHEGDTLFEILEENYILEYEHYLGLGNMITRIDDLIQKENMYIFIFINDEHATTGIDLIIPKDGMIVMFKLE